MDKLTAARCSRHPDTPPRRRRQLAQTSPSLGNTAKAVALLDA
jgi:hypothetical protein